MADVKQENLINLITLSSKVLCWNNLLSGPDFMPIDKSITRVVIPKSLPSLLLNSWSSIQLHYSGTYVR